MPNAGIRGESITLIQLTPIRWRELQTGGQGAPDPPNASEAAAALYLGWGMTPRIDWEQLNQENTNMRILYFSRCTAYQRTCSGKPCQRS